MQTCTHALILCTAKKEGEITWYNFKNDVCVCILWICRSYGPVIWRSVEGSSRMSDYKLWFKVEISQNDSIQMNLMLNSCKLIIGTVGTGSSCTSDFKRFVTSQKLFGVILGECKFFVLMWTLLEGLNWGEFEDK
jgi:hypothetical protein